MRPLPQKQALGILGRQPWHHLFGSDAIFVLEAAKMTMMRHPEREASFPTTSDGQDSLAREGSTRKNHVEPTPWAARSVPGRHFERPLVISSGVLCARLSGVKKTSRVSLKVLLEQFPRNSIKTKTRTAAVALVSKATKGNAAAVRCAPEQFRWESEIKENLHS